MFVPLYSMADIVLQYWLDRREHERFKDEFTAT
jgi:hypothetical protein